MKRMKRTWILAAALAVWVSLPAASRANVQEASGLSPKATAMGEAFLAQADDPSAISFNPPIAGRI